MISCGSCPSGFSDSQSFIHQLHDWSVSRRKQKRSSFLPTYQRLIPSRNKAGHGSSWTMSFSWSTPSRRFSFMAVPAESCSLKAFSGMNPRRDVRLQEMETSVLKFKEIKLNCFYKTTPTFSHAALKCRQPLLFPSHQRIYLQFNVFFTNTSQRWREDLSVCLDSSACPPQIWFLIRTQTEERRRWRWLSNKKRQRLEEGLEGRERE